MRVVRSEDGWQPVREVRHNLPRERDAFVGRAADLAAVAARFDAGARVLTVLGPGGTGKTRLARRYGEVGSAIGRRRLLLRPLGSADAGGRVLRCRPGARRAPRQDDPGVQLGHAIATRGRCLVILDNFEQIVEHAEATVGRWADRAPDAGFLVTSRERLRLAGEAVLPLEPLPIDADGVELFALRARAQRPDFALTPKEPRRGPGIVALLDGLPLAIELAAARARVLSPAQLLERLSDRFSLLAGARTAADRQATLRGAIDWSWNLLQPWEQAALAQCSVFEGGFTLDAAEAVLELSSWADAPSIVDVVQMLVDKSLLRTWAPVDQSRHALDEPYFGMYLTIHEYAAEKLATSGAERRRAAQERHGRHFARFGSENACSPCAGRGAGARRSTLTLELDNLVAACKRAVAHGDGGDGGRHLRAAGEAVCDAGPLRPRAIDLGPAGRRPGARSSRRSAPRRCAVARTPDRRLPVGSIRRCRCSSVLWRSRGRRTTRRAKPTC
jgi:predicted ATPase